MTSRIAYPRVAALILLLAVTGCARDLTGLDPATFPNTAEVFTDGLAAGVDFQAFAGSDPGAVSVDQSVAHAGGASLRIDVPEPSDPAGSYAGGAFTASIPRDLSSYNAITFWARASRSAHLDVAGLGNDNTGTSRYTAEVDGLELSTTWQQYAVPIPLPGRLTQEGGLFYFAEGAEDGQAYSIWIDDLRFESLATVTSPRPSLPSAEAVAEVGGTLQVTGTTVTFSVSGADLTESAAPAYFDFASSDEAVATVDENGLISVVGPGSATITASLGGVAADGSVTVSTALPPDSPAPTPTIDPVDGRVVSLFSDAYQDIPVDTWSATWDQADVEDVTIDGNATKHYTNMVYAGVEFTGSQVDASGLTNFTMDVWVDDASEFRIKLVDFGADGAFGGGDDVEHEVILGPDSDPALVAGRWNTLDVPLSAFTGLTTRGHIAQLIISSSSASVYLDNIFFYAAGGATEPTVAAPTPTRDAARVLSLFSDAYTDVPVDTWLTGWSDAQLEDVAIAGNAAKKYTNLVFAGVELVSQPLDVSGMTTFHIDVWTPDPTSLPAAFRVKLVDFGADGAFGGGDDVEDELSLTDASDPPLRTGSWVSFDVSLDAFTNLTTRQHIAQIVLSGDPNTVFIDNVYFYAAAATEPTQPAPTPTIDAANVISLFSDAYTDVTVDTWRTDWSDATLEDVTIAGNATKKYTNLVFVGVEMVASPVDVSAMTHFHLDVWTPDPTADPAAFRVKLVDFGADGAFGGDDDVEHEVTLTASSTPALASGTWLSLEIPLSDFANLTTRNHIAQLILSGDPNTVFVDNVYFHN